MADEGYQPFPDISAWTAVPFDPTTYDQYAALLEQARAEATEEAREHAVKTAMRYAGTDTGAIEGLYTTDRGFTRTVAIEAAGWEAAANERGPNAAEVIKDQIAAYEWVLDLVTQERPVTEHVIRELHAMLCRSQDTYVVHTEVGPQERALPKGEYKTHPNNPTSLATGRIHHYAPPDMVSPEMGRLVGSLSTDAYRNAHPVVQAAYLHYALAAIHPFADGNGRVARAIASVPLYRALRVPLMVFRDQRDEYLDALERADAGDLRGFVAFVLDRTIDLADLVAMTTTLGPAADRERSLAALARSMRGFGADTSDVVAGRLLSVLQTEIQRQVDELALPHGVVAHVSASKMLPDDLPETYRPIRHATADPVSVAIEWSVVGHGGHHTVVAPLVPETGEGDLVVGASTPGTRALRVPFSDIAPSLRSTAKLKFAHWIAFVIDSELAALGQRSR